MRHLDIKSAFTTEKFQHDRPVFVRQLLAFNGDYRHPDKRVGKLLLKLYGTENACFIHLQSLYAHLSSNGYRPCEADTCVFFKYFLTSASSRPQQSNNFLSLHLRTTSLTNLNQHYLSNTALLTLEPRKSFLVEQYSARAPALFTYHSRCWFQNH